MCKEATGIMSWRRVAALPPLQGSCGCDFQPTVNLHCEIQGDEGLQEHIETHMLLVGGTSLKLLNPRGHRQCWDSRG